MADKINKTKSGTRRGGVFFISMAVGASAISAYYMLFTDELKDGVKPFLRRLMCQNCSRKDECGQWDSTWDKQSLARFVKENASDDSSSKNKKLVTRHLIFVRHGQYNDAVKHDPDRILTATGRQQAVYTGRRLRELGIRFDTVVHSTMTRAVETCDLIVKELSLDPNTAIPTSETDLLREGHPMVPIPYYGKSITNKDQERIDSAFENFFYRPPSSQVKDTFELYVCHANVIRYLALRALQLAPTAWLRFSIAHASITWIAIRSDGTVSLRRMGDAGHIPVDLETR